VLQRSVCVSPLQDRRGELYLSQEKYDCLKDVDNPLIGKLVKILALGGVSFHDPDSSDEDLDLNWKRLRIMAYPVVDGQLATMAGNGR
jgi:hypothetical protein